MFVAVGILVAPTVGQAAVPAARTPSSPVTPELPADPQTELAELERRATKLSKEYRGTLVKVDEVKKAAKKANKRLDEVNKDLEKARKQVARLAASKYMSAGLEPALTPLMTSDPEAVLDKAVTAQHLAQSTRDRLAQLSTLKKQRERARKIAEERLDDLRKELDELEAKRDKVQDLMAEFRPQAPIIGGENITPRMRQVRDLVIQNFGAPYAIGCYRAGSWGEHPLGRACDFMLSTGGSMPTQYQEERGWDIANWATANASELGIMYVIYRQQIWDIRSGGGWEMMEDRGSITANHYDHVHISVF